MAEQYNPMDAIRNAQNPSGKIPAPSNFSFLRSATPEERQKRLAHLKDNFYDKSLEELQYLSAYETARVHQFMPFRFSNSKNGTINGALNTTSQELGLSQFEEGYLYIVTSITAFESAGTPQIKLAIKNKFTNEYFILKSGSVLNAEDSVSVTGSFVVQAQDLIVALFEGASATDTITLNVHGYRIRL